MGYKLQTSHYFMFLPPRCCFIRLGRMLERTCSSWALHFPPHEIIIVLNNHSSQQPSTTNIFIPRHIIHWYVIHQKVSSIHGHHPHLLQSPHAAPTVEGWSLHLKLHAHYNISCWSHHLSSSRELLPWYSNIMLTHLCTLLDPMIWTSQVANPSVTLKPWECTSRCHHQ